MAYSQETTRILKKLQKAEIKGYYLYMSVSKRVRDPENAKLMRRIADEEKRHYEIFTGYTGEEINGNSFSIKAAVFINTIIALLFGLTFTLKIFEKIEAATTDYLKAAEEIPEINKIIEDEENHEQKLIALIDEEKLSYIGSVVLGLNDALVELTGALAGFTLSVRSSRTIALLGLITGISAAFSMAASEYLSSKAEKKENFKPGRASLYTGIAYIFTVVLLVLPFLFLSNYLAALLITIGIAMAVIAVFNFYISVAMDEGFFSRFLEMAIISIGVAAVSFLIGFLVKKYLGLDL